MRKHFSNALIAATAFVGLGLSGTGGAVATPAASDSLQLGTEAP